MTHETDSMEVPKSPSWSGRARTTIEESANATPTASAMSAARNGRRRASGSGRGSRTAVERSAVGYSAVTATLEW